MIPYWKSLSNAVFRGFGTWPVAMLGVGKSKTQLEGPVCDGSRVVGWHTNGRSSRSRRFHVNTSGFAFNSTMLWDADKRAHQAWNYIRLLDTVREGFQVTCYLLCLCPCPKFLWY